MTQHEIRGVTEQRRAPSKRKEERGKKEANKERQIIPVTASSAILSLSVAPEMHNLGLTCLLQLVQWFQPFHLTGSRSHVPDPLTPRGNSHVSKLVTRAVADM